MDEEKKKSTIKLFEKDKISVLTGKYGPYIKQGRKNFKIPKNIEAKDLTIEDCIKIIESDPKSKSKSTSKDKSKSKSKKNTNSKK